MNMIILTFGNDYEYDRIFKNMKFLCLDYFLGVM